MAKNRYAMAKAGMKYPMGGKIPYSNQNEMNEGRPMTYPGGGHMKYPGGMAKYMPKKYRAGTGYYRNTENYTAPLHYKYKGINNASKLGKAARFASGAMQAAQALGGIPSMDGGAMAGADAGMATGATAPVSTAGNPTPQMSAEEIQGAPDIVDNYGMFGSALAKRMGAGYVKNMKPKMRGGSRMKKRYT